MPDRGFLLFYLYHCLVDHTEIVLYFLKHPRQHRLSILDVSLCMFFPSIILTLLSSEAAYLRFEREKLYSLLLKTRDQHADRPWQILLFDQLLETYLSIVD